MNRLVIIGNGFDIAHGLKTSYMDFINWYLEQRLNVLLAENPKVSKDCLCEFKKRVQVIIVGLYISDKIIHFGTY